MSDPKLIQALRERGVVVHAPDSTLVEGIDPTRIESGVEIWIPGETETTRETVVATDDASEAPIEEPSDPSQLAENQAGPSDDEEAKMTPQQREALEILADFVNLTS